MTFYLSSIGQWAVKTGRYWAARERGRFFNWLPVGLAFGIGFYFWADAEPEIWVGPTASAVSAGLAALCWRFNLLRITFLFLLAVSVGFAGAEWRSIRVKAPQLEWQQWSREVTGTIAQISEKTDQNSKVLLENLSIAGLPQANTPKRISVSLRANAATLTPDALKSDALKAGDVISVKATLMPPGPPTIPGGFDYARQAYFAGIGAVGYAIAPAVKVGQRVAFAQPWLQRFSYGLERLRNQVSSTFRTEIPGAEGGLAAALTTGIRDGIPKDVVVNMRNSGLAHLLAIAGLHLSMVAGLIFFVSRAALASVPALALNYPIKKWAAALAGLVALGYLLLSGASLPTIRAFLMGGLVFAAILLDRNPISMRLLTLAAVFILIIKPEALLSVSFQMSFAAVMALIAVYEGLHMPMTRLQADRGRVVGLLIRALTGVSFICLTTVIATVATGPFSVYHFNQLALYGVLGNVLAVPLTGLWILPWAIVAIILMPFHLEWLAMAPLAWGTKLLVLIAARVSALPHAVALLPGFSLTALGVMAFGGVWLCLWRSPVRWAGVLMVAGGVMMAWNPPRPDILIDDRGKLMAVIGQNGQYLVSNLRSDKYARAIWLRANGQAETGMEKWPIPAKPRKRKGEDSPEPVVDVAGDPSLECNRERCFYTPPNKGNAGATVSPGPRILLWWGKGDIAGDCGQADVMISTEAARQECPNTRLMIDRFDTYYYGSQALWIERLPGGGFKFRVTSAISDADKRPWTNRREAPVWLKTSRARAAFTWQGAAVKANSVSD
jgi:competence protein ComEC